jgi:hypothetical protein
VVHKKKGKKPFFYYLAPHTNSTSNNFQVLVKKFDLREQAIKFPTLDTKALLKTKDKEME